MFSQRHTRRPAGRLLLAACVLFAWMALPCRGGEVRLRGLRRVENLERPSFLPPSGGDPRVMAREGDILGLVAADCRCSEAGRRWLYPYPGGTVLHCGANEWSLRMERDGEKRGVGLDLTRSRARKWLQGPGRESCMW